MTRNEKGDGILLKKGCPALKIHGDAAGPLLALRAVTGIYVKILRLTLN
jgi:hypothetical protein